MKKLFTISLVSISLFVFGQSPTFQVGDNVINLGIGFGGYYSGSITTPPVSISYEYGLLENFLIDGAYLGIGGFLGYASSRYQVPTVVGVFGWDYNYLTIAARGNWHYTFVDKLDTYFGLGLGYYNISYTEIGNMPIAAGNNPDAGRVFLSGHLGARYYFTDNLAAMLELGWGASVANVGVAFKF